MGRYFASLAAAGGWGSTATIADVIFAHVFPVPRKMRFDKIGCAAEAAPASGSRARVGVYNSDGDGKPNALLADSGELNIEGYGMKEATINLTLDKGLYFIAFLCNTSSAYLDACSSFLSPLGGATSFFSVGRWERNFAYGPLPNPFGSPNTEILSNEILATGLRLAELL